MEIFETDNYKEIVKNRIKSMPNNGRGQYKAIAKALSIHTTMVSQIFNGSKDLNPDQAYELCEFLGLVGLEIDYFLALIERERAASYKLKKHVQNKIESLREQSQQIKNRLPNKKTLSEKEISIFYSRWYFSAIRLLCSTLHINTADEIALALGLKITKVREVLAFLVRVGLLEQTQDTYKVIPGGTHAEKGTTASVMHHTNWRLKSIEGLENQTDSELYFTAPMSLSEKDIQAIKKKILAVISDIGKTVKDSNPETVYCLNIDWFSVINKK